MARISLSEVSTGSWSFKQDVETFASLGVEGIGVVLPKLEAHGVASGIQLLRDAGLGVSYLIPRTNMPLTDPDSQRAAIERLKSASEIAGQLGTRCMYVLSGVDYQLTWEESARRFRDGLAQVLPSCEQAGVVLSIEPVLTVRCDLSFLHSEWDAAHIAAELNSPAAGIVAEIQVLWRERGIAEFARQHAQRVFSFQASDYAAGTICASQREVVGEGVIPIESIIRAMHEGGYRGWYDVELLGPALERDGYASALQRSGERLREIVDRVEAG